MKTAVVLFSGGQDSTTCLYLARGSFERVVALSVHYGQRHRAELEAASKIAHLAGVEHKVIDLPEFGHLVGAATALVRPEVAEAAQPALAGDGGIPDAAMPQGLPTSFVPGRNALLLTLAASYAASLGARDVVTGVCQTDYSGYPDCREEFVQAMEAALNLAMPSSLRPVKLHTPLMHLTKAATVVLAKNTPGAWEGLALSVTCYEGQRPGCGACAACVLRARGFAEVGEVDPAVAAMTVDRSKRTLTDGSPVTRDHLQIRPDGQQKAYVVLSDEERSKGFVRPVRRSYRHVGKSPTREGEEIITPGSVGCGASTTMGVALAETYARDPSFYSGTFCATCRDHFPVGADGEFVWDGTNERVGT